jgi:hypothetical protein
VVLHQNTHGSLGVKKLIFPTMSKIAEFGQENTRNFRDQDVRRLSSSFSKAGPTSDISEHREAGKWFNP